MLRPGAVVVDVGINVVGGRLVGDVDFETARRVASAITPVPGGIGPLTNASAVEPPGPRGRSPGRPTTPRHPRSPMTFPSDLEIARSVRPRRIADVAGDLGIRDDELELYGPTKAKVTLDAIRRLETERPKGKYVVVTAITPTPLGEGKSTTTVGLAQGLNVIGRKAAVCIRQPSLGSRLRDQGWGRRGRVQPGDPDGGLQPPSHRRRPRDRRSPQPRSGVPRQPPPPQERAGHRPARDPVAARRRHQRPGCAQGRHRHGRSRERDPARDRMGDHGRVRGDGRARTRDRPPGPPGSAGTDRPRDQDRRDAGDLRGPRRRRLDDRAADRRDQAEPAADARRRSRVRALRAVRQHRPWQQLDPGRPACARHERDRVHRGRLRGRHGCREVLQHQVPRVRASTGCGRHGGNDPCPQDARRGGQDRGGQAARSGPARGERRGGQGRCRQPGEADRERAPVQRPGRRRDQRLPDRHGRARSRP